MEVLQLSVSKRRLNSRSSNRSAADQQNYIAGASTTTGRGAQANSA
jgi:hypothetical protein